MANVPGTSKDSKPIPKMADLVAAAAELKKKRRRIENNFDTEIHPKNDPIHKLLYRKPVLGALHQDEANRYYKKLIDRDWAFTTEVSFHRIVYSRLKPSSSVAVIRNPHPEKSKYELIPPLWRDPAYRKLKQENADKVFHDLIKRDGPAMDTYIHPKKDPIKKLLYRTPVFEKFSQKIANKNYAKQLENLRSEDSRFDTTVQQEPVVSRVFKDVSVMGPKPPMSSKLPNSAFKLQGSIWRTPCYRKTRQQEADKYYHDLISRDYRLETEMDPSDFSGLYRTRVLGQLKQEDADKYYNALIDRSGQALDTTMRKDSRAWKSFSTNVIDLD